MKILLHKAFEKKYVKAPPNIKKKFKIKRDLFLRDQFHPLLKTHSLEGDRKGEWSINITGDWRALFVYLSKDNTIFIDLDTHSNLYK